MLSLTSSMRQSRLLAAVVLLLVSIPATEVVAQDFPLFVAGYDGLGVYSLDAGGALTVRGVVSGLLNSVREDKDGNLYTCSDDSADVSRIDPAGNVSVYVTGLSGCFGLLLAPNGSLYVSNVFAGNIEIVPPGGGSFTTLASGLDTPMHLAFDADGSILVTEFLGGRLSRVEGTGTVSLVAAGLENPVGVAVAADGQVYVSELFTGRLMRIDSAGTASPLLTRLDAGPTGLEFHHDGRLFVAEFFLGQITAVDVAAATATVFRDGLVLPAGLSFHRTPAPSVLQVLVDLKPGSDENPLNPKANGLIPVAVLASAEFDATAIDPSSVRFGVTGTEATPAHSHVEDVNGDGRLDMVFHFPNKMLGISPALPNQSLVPLTLKGQTLDGQLIEGQDVGRITPGNPH